MEIYTNPQTVKVQNTSLRYYRYGKGEVVIFLHGITTYSFIWRKVVPYFFDNYDVILVDLLGSGESDKPLEQDFSLKRQAHLIKDFCQELGINRFHLVCHDVGGGIGQIMAVNYPELIYNLVLVNTVAYNFWPVQPIILMRTPVLRQFAMATLDYGMFEIIIRRGLYHKSKLTKELKELFFKPMRTTSGRKGFLRFAKCLDNKNLMEIEDKLRELKIPVCIIRGEADLYLSSSISDRLHSEIPGSKLMKIQTGGHFIQEDEPEKISKIILNFLLQKAHEK